MLSVLPDSYRPARLVALAPDYGPSMPGARFV
jgi:hypothetical protein